MNDLNHIISSLSLEEQTRFTEYLRKKNRRNDTKNIQLFKLISRDHLTSEALCKKLYKDGNKAAYHALRKRLLQSLIDFIANISIEEENSVDMQAIKYILASRTFLLNNKPIIAYKLLHKAEILAKEHNLFAILNEIYHTKIQYAHTNSSIELEAEIEKYKINQKKHQLEDQLNMVYAKVRQTLNQITYKGETINFQTLFESILKEHNISLEEAVSFKSVYQLMTIISISAFVTNDYLQVEPFLISIYTTIKNQKDKDKQAFYHIQVLYLISNTLFRNKKFEDSLVYLDLMQQKMLDKNKKHYNTFLLKHYKLLALNYNFSNRQEEAIALLESVKNRKHNDMESLLDIHLGLVMFYFQKGSLKNAQNILSKLYHTDNWYMEKAGKEWVIKKNLIEILLYIDLNLIDLVESRLLSFKRSYFKYLQEINQERVITYLQLIEYYYKNPEKVTSRTFKEKVENSFVWISPDQEDIFVMSFYAWLKSKMENRTLYETTTDLVNQSKAIISN